MENRKILVVCSDLDFLLITKMLEIDFEVNRLKKIEDIMNGNQKKNYNLLLVDISFLKSDMELTSKLKEVGCKIVALSSEFADAQDHNMKNWGYDACYVKPFQLKTFSLFVQYWCN